MKNSHGNLPAKYFWFSLDVEIRGEGIMNDKKRTFFGTIVSSFYENSIFIDGIEEEDSKKELENLFISLLDR